MNKICLNQGWQFFDNDKASYVDVPHTVKVEKLDVCKNYQGDFVYTKELYIGDEHKNSNLFLEFEGVMINCVVIVNGIEVKKHFGGYLPFVAEITNFVGFNKTNVISVRVSNFDDSDTPPGKATKGLDFLYYGGIYRNVNLIIYPKVYLTYPTEDEERGGGIKIIPSGSKNNWLLDITANIKNTYSDCRNFEIVFNVCDKENIIKSLKTEVDIPNREIKDLDVSMVVDSVMQWDLSNPKLYLLKLEILKNGEKVFENITEFGFRSVSVDADGFRLNGELIRLFGVNRHQQFPYIGIAASDEAQAREAKLLKDSGVNILRLAHYPQSEAFLTACDRLGLLLIDPVPGWQYWGGKLFKERLQQNLKDMIRRDRNHPSVVIYEITPNESNWATRSGDTYLKHMKKLAHHEYKNCLTSGDVSGRWNAKRIGFDIPHFGKDGMSIFRKLYANGERKFLKREYGDWAFGGNNSSSRVSRGDGERNMQIQAWNFQWHHNMNFIKENLLGDIIWEGIDHNRGYYPKAPISKSGIFDIFRLPKLSYNFVSTQNNSDNYVIKPMFISFLNKKKLVFYSNCERISLHKNGVILEERSHDNGEDDLYDATKNKEINDNYWLTNKDHIETSEQESYLAKHTINCLYNGGNCKKLLKPPFTFNNLQLDGADYLTFIGYVNGKEVVHYDFYNPQTAVGFQIEIADKGIKLVPNNNDFVFVYVKAVDDNNNIDVTYNKKVQISIQNGTSIYTSEIKAEAGIASFLVKANMGAKKMMIVATSDDFSANQNYILHNDIETIIN